MERREEKRQKHQNSVKPNKYWDTMIKYLPFLPQGTSLSIAEKRKHQRCWNIKGNIPLFSLLTEDKDRCQSWSMRGVEQRKPLNKEGESKILNKNLKTGRVPKTVKPQLFQVVLIPCHRCKQLSNVGLLELCHVNNVERKRFLPYI